MNEETVTKLKDFNIVTNEEGLKLGNDYKRFEPLLKNIISGEGMIGENNYLILWGKGEIGELNNEYAVKEFLHDIILIGSDGGDIAYGLTADGDYIEVPFIGMDDSEIRVIAKTFDQFINYLWNKP